MQPHPEHKTGPLFDAVGCVVRCDQHILLLHRAANKSYPERWGLPGGKVEQGETLLQAAIRELFEETRILLSADQLSVFSTYDVVNADMRFNFTVLLHKCAEKPHVAIDSSSHIAFGWFTTDDALRLPLVPQLEPILQEVSESCCEEEELALLQAPRPNARDSTLLLEGEVQRTTNACIVPSQFNVGKIWYASLGPPGVGKTTTLQAMHRQNPAYTLVTDEIILRPSSRLNYYLIQAFEHDNKLYFFRFQMEVLAVRWQQAMMAPNLSLVDETIYSTLAYSRALYYLGWISKTEYQTFFVHYLHYREMLPPPTKVFQFTCELEVVMRRIRSRSGRRWEHGFTKEYLHALERSFLEVASELRMKLNVVPIDTTRMPTEEIVKLYGL